METAITVSVVLAEATTLGLHITNLASSDLNVQGGELLSLLLLLVLPSTVFRSGEAQSKAFLINCGTDSSLNVDGRKWVGDLTPDNNLTLSSPGVVASTSSLSGNYFLRHHFCPFSFEDHNVNESSFDVVANGLKLLARFNAVGEIAHKNLYLKSSGSNSSSFSLVKEYILPIISNTVVIEFTPTKGSFGFINAIEMVPMTDKLFADSVSKVGGNDANLNLSGRGIEIMYRLNVGGPEINPSEDSNYWRAWDVDSGYMITANAGSEIHNSSNVTYASANDSSVAPLLVYETARSMSNNQVLEKRFNMSWRFEVDPDFDYLIRLHFCELVFDKPSLRIFRIYINNRTAANNYDLFVKAGGMNKAYHQDYFDAVSSQINTLWIQLGPDTAAGASGTDALLNGLEIFKLSRNGNLVHVQRYDSTGSSNHPSKLWVLWVGIAAGVASVAILAVAVIRIICFCKKQGKESGDTKNNTPGWRPLFLHGSILNSSANAKRSSRLQNPNGSMASTEPGAIGGSEHYKPYPSLAFNPSPALINLLNIHPLFSNYEPYPNLPSIPCKQICHRPDSNTGRTRPPRGGEMDPTAPLHARQNKATSRWRGRPHGSIPYKQIGVLKPFTLRRDQATSR
ncbi:hypothetical protein V6N13_011027 [Hibiscus sabdariffa]